MELLEVAFAPNQPPLRVWRLRGDGSGPAAHLQGGVHADEIPPSLVLHRLLPRLRAAEAGARLRGDVVVIPQANPIGAAQAVAGRLIGRFELASGRNFNRGYPAAYAGSPDPFVAWQAKLLELAAPARIVLDLHTDDEALPYIYVPRSMWPRAERLAAAVGAAAVITSDPGDGGGAFEDAVALDFVARGIDGLVSTVELRGQADVSDALAEADADGLLNLLRAEGVVAGEPHVPEWSGEVVPLDHIQLVDAEHAGVVVMTRPLGAWLEAGETFARLLPCPGDHSADRSISAPLPGRLLTHTRDRLVRAGGRIAKLTAAGPPPIARRGPLHD